MKDSQLIRNIIRESLEDESIKNWGGFGQEEEEMVPEDFFGDESIQALDDIADEYGEDNIAEFGSTEDAKSFIKSLIKKEVKESLLDEDDITEERIVNKKAKNFVNKKENFIGSHIYGEDLGGLGKMYVAYSYGEQFPLYVHYKGKWYHNKNQYIVNDRVNKPTEKHKDNMRPTAQTTGITLSSMQKMIRKFKKENKLGENNHTDVEPGEKN
jgi:hypothetical protein